MGEDVSKAGDAYSMLKELVTNYNFIPDPKLRVAPGEHLQIDDLADRVKVSATPVREALARLHGESLVDRIPKRGFFSKIPDLIGLRDLYEFVLPTLEHSIRKYPKTLREAARLIPGLADMERRARARRGALSAVQIEAWMIETVFERIARLSKNQEAVRAIRNFNDRSRYVRCLFIDENINGERPGDGPRTLLGPLIAGDADQACFEVRGRLTREIERLPELVRTGEEDVDMHDADRLAC